MRTETAKWAMQLLYLEKVPFFSLNNPSKNMSISTRTSPIMPVPAGKYTKDILILRYLNRANMTLPQLRTLSEAFGVPYSSML
jgi:hypothetical protein